MNSLSSESSVTEVIGLEGLSGYRSIVLEFAKLNLGRDIISLSAEEVSQFNMDNVVTSAGGASAVSMAAEGSRYNGRDSVGTFQSEVVREFINFEKWIRMYYPLSFEGRMLNAMYSFIAQRGLGINEPIVAGIDVHIPIKNVYADLRSLIVGQEVMAFPCTEVVQEKDQAWNLRLRAIIQQISSQGGKHGVVVTFPIDVFAFPETLVTTYLTCRYNGEGSTKKRKAVVEDVVVIGEGAVQEAEDLTFTHFPSANKAQWAIGTIMKLLELPNVIIMPKVIDMVNKWKETHTILTCPALQMCRDLPWIRDMVCRIAIEYFGIVENYL